MEIQQRTQEKLILISDSYELQKNLLRLNNLMGPKSGMDILYY